MMRMDTKLLLALGGSRGLLSPWRCLRPTAWWVAMWVVLTCHTTSAQAQSGGDRSETETSDAGEGNGRSWRQPRLLILPQRRTPPEILRQVVQLTRDIGELVIGSEFIRAARARGFDPTSAEAFEALLAEQQVDVVVVVGYARRAGRSYLQLTYREGRGGFELLEEEHAIPGNQIGEEVEWRILNELRLAINTVLAPGSAEGGEKQPSTTQLPAIVLPMQRERDERLPSAPPSGQKLALHIGMSVGFGMGTRSFYVPTQVTPVRLANTLFPAMSLRLFTEYEPRAQGRLTWTAEARYLTSLGLKTTDTRLDGSTATTGSRSHRLDIEGGLRYRITEGKVSVALGGAFGWGLRFFSSEAAVTVPNFFMAGPYLRPAVRVGFLQDRVIVGADPLLEWLAIIDHTLTDAGLKSMAFALGIEAQVQYRVLNALSLVLLFRESHAFLSAPGISPNDTERLLVLQAVYRP